MTRPAINYDTTLSVPGHYSFYRADGSHVDGTYSAALARRLMSKPASTKTVPKAKGQFYLPTNYEYIFGIWSTVGSCQASARSPFVSWVSDTSPFSSLGFDPKTAVTVPSWVWNKLEIKALNKIRNSQVNYGVMLAEAGETSHLFQTTALRIANAVRTFRAKSPSDFAKAVRYSGSRSWRKVPSSWLEVQYGWNPLMSDLNGSLANLDSNPVRQENLVIVKSSWKDKTTYSYSIPSSYVGSDRQVECDREAKVKLTYKLNNFTLALLSSLGLVNPLEIIWERVPYSFVIDWFLPVGNWLSALSGDFGFSFQNGHRTQFIRYLDQTGTLKDGGLTISPYGTSISGRAVYFNRSTYASSPWPGLYLKSPVSSGHIANAMSLLSQAFRAPHGVPRR